MLVVAAGRDERDNDGLDGFMDFRWTVTPDGVEAEASSDVRFRFF
jgi:hypothetical protein